MKRLELVAPKTKEVFIYLCICHKLSGYEQLQNKEDKS